MSSQKLDSQTQWEVDRYVLNDETLDRTKFESRMLADERLAWAVMEAVEQMEVLSATVQSTTSGEVTQVARVPSATAGGWMPSAVSGWRLLGRAGLLVAATILLILLVQASLPDARPVASGSGTDDLSAVAEQWLALDAATDDGENYVTSSALEGEVVEASAEDDWMVEAAQQFFQEVEI